MEKIKKYFFYFSIVHLGLLLFLIVTSFFWTEESMRPAVNHIFEFPSEKFWLGTDSLGRDLLRRIILGARVSLFVGLLGAIATTSLGILLGVWAGWQGGWVDRVLMRLSDIFIAIPYFALLAVLNLFFQQLLGSVDFSMKIILSLVLSLMLTHWMSILRVVRSQVIQIKNYSYLDAARSLGGTPIHILVRHVRPALVPLLWVLFALQIPSSLLSESFMSFVGLGVQAPMTSWGVLVSEGWKALSTYPHLILAPSFVIFLTVFSFHTIIEHFQGESNHQKWTP